MKETATEKRGYKIGDKLVKSNFRGRAVCSVTGFTEKYVRASDGNLFDPEHHSQRGSVDYASYSYAKATDEEIVQIKRENRQKRIVSILYNTSFNDMTLEELEKVFSNLPERFTKQ